MKTSTEEFLYFLLWSADSIVRPTWRNLTDDFETWAWRNGHGPSIAQLARRKLLEPSPGFALTRIARLTEEGRRLAIGGRDPEQSWARSWDGRWRMVIFDVPEIRRHLRMQLWRLLRRKGFGYLQNSVWITPDPLDWVRRIIANELSEVESLVLVEGRPCGGESDADLVKGSWDFDRINAQYSVSISLLSHPPRNNEISGLLRWGHREREAWNRAIQKDPLLPRPLLPAGYLGETAWILRNRVIAEVATRAGVSGWAA